MHAEKTSIGGHDAVDGDIVVPGMLPELLDTGLHPLGGGAVLGEQM